MGVATVQITGTKKHSLDGTIFFVAAFYFFNYWKYATNQVLG